MSEEATVKEDEVTMESLTLERNALQSQLAEAQLYAKKLEEMAERWAKHISALAKERDGALALLKSEKITV